MFRFRSATAFATALMLVATACSSSDPSRVTVITHDTFAISDATIDAFEEETGIEVTFLTSSDAGSLVAEASLTKDNPLADVMYGIDNTFLSRGLEEDLFEPYQTPALTQVPNEFRLDSQNRVTPIDYGDVCINAMANTDGALPGSLDDLRSPEFAGQWITQNPETSSPGLAMLLATVATYGEEGWENFWRDAADSGVGVTAGWSEAYATYGSDYSLMTSYASSPVAEVLFAEDPIDEPLSVIIPNSCFRQIEFAGVLRNASNPEGAKKFIDFMLSDTFQNDIPLNMFVYPVSESATLPDEFIAHATPVPNPLTLDPDLIGERREAWTARWVEIVLR